MQVMTHDEDRVIAHVGHVDPADSSSPMRHQHNANPPVEAIRALVNYLHAEQDDFEGYDEGEAPENHIWLSVKAVSEWLNTLRR